jgi:tripartite-type tricarboxylate transporter receptor subunit TctC
MKKLITILMATFALSASAKELITLVNGTSPSQPNVATYIRTLDAANKLQDKYEFVIEMKPGANGALSLKFMDLNPMTRLSTIAPAFVENSKQGLINEADYVPVLGQGDACWAIITNIGDTKKGVASLKGQKEIIVGGTGFGNASHITAIMLGERYGFSVRYVVYKANYDALVNMAGNNDVNFVIERIQNYKIFKERNPRLQVLGINCPKRNPAMPEIRTLKEQGFDTPTIFFTVVANTKMPKEKRDELSKILIEAQSKVGADFMLESADLFAPQFSNPPVTIDEFFVKRVSQMHYLTRKYKDEIDKAR